MKLTSSCRYTAQRYFVEKYRANALINNSARTSGAAAIVTGEKVYSCIFIARGRLNL